MSDMLYERDWNFIVDTIYEINAEEDPKRVGRIALEALFVLIPSDQIMLTYMEKTDQLNLRCKDVDTVGMPALYLDKFLAGDYNDDPYFLYCNVLKETKCFRDSDNMSDSYRESTPIFKDIYSKQGIYYSMRSYLAYKGSIVANISIFNSKERGDFSDRDLFILDLLAPHVALKLGRIIAEKNGEEKRPVSPEQYDKWGLTTREQEIANLVVEGMPDDQIADSLCIAKSTFKKHIYNIYQKVDVNNRVQLYAALTKDTSGQGVRD